MLSLQVLLCNLLLIFRFVWQPPEEMKSGNSLAYSLFRMAYKIWLFALVVLVWGVAAYVSCFFLFFVVGCVLLPNVILPSQRE